MDKNKDTFKMPPDPKWIVGKHALMNVNVHNVDGKTIIEPHSWRIPFQWQGYHYQDNDDQPFMLMVNSGGGYVEGDKSYFLADLQNNTRSLFTTTASGKFYKCLNGGLTEEVVEFNVGQNSLLEYLPDEAIPFEASRSKRSIKINLTGSSRLFATDMVSGGRIHYGNEVFKFHYLKSQFQIYLNGLLIAQDKLLLKNTEEVRDLTTLWQGARHSVTIFAYADNFPEKVEDMIYSNVGTTTTVKIGVSRIENLLVIRSLAFETWQAHEVIFEIWKILRPFIAHKAARPISKC